MSSVFKRNILTFWRHWYHTIMKSSDLKKWVFQMYKDRFCHAFNRNILSYMSSNLSFFQRFRSTNFSDMAKKNAKINLIFSFVSVNATADVDNIECSHVELSLTICTDLWAFFPWGSVKIVPLLRKDNCRSARIFTDVQGFSVQIFLEIFFRSFWETIYCIFGILQQVFLLTKSQSVESLHRPKFLSRKACPDHSNLGVWGMFGIGFARQFIHFTWTFQKWLFNFERLVCHIDFNLADVIRRVATVWVGRGVEVM